MKHGVKRYIFRQAFKDIMPRSLYSVRIKEDTSVTNIKPDENWYEEYSRRKQEIIGALDRHF